MAKAAAAAAAGAAGSNYPVIRDKAAIQAAEDFAIKYAEYKRLDAELDVLKGTVLAAMAGAPKAMFGKRIVSSKDYAPLPPTDNVVISKDMLGQVIEGKSGRAGYTRIWVR